MKVSKHIDQCVFQQQQQTEKEKRFFPKHQEIKSRTFDATYTNIKQHTVVVVVWVVVVVVVVDDDDDDADDDAVDDEHQFVSAYLLTAYKSRIPMVSLMIVLSW